MIIRKIKLRNIKSYYGEHVLELPRPNMGRNLHLVGAYNGSGKTTLFEVINACLLATQEKPILMAEYISRGINAHDMEVELEFEHDEHLWRLNRSWVRNPSISETSKRSVTLSSLLQNLTTGESYSGENDEETITEFINYLVPQQISHFFLFDGEQIQQYTGESAGQVRDAIERLLGLHHYIQLRTDLSGRVEADLKAARDSLNVGSDLNNRLDARDSIESTLKSNARRSAQLKKSASETRRELEVLGRRGRDIDAVFDEDYKAKRRELEGRQDRLQRDIEDTDGELKKLIANELVVALFWQEIQQAYSELSRSHAPVNASLPLELGGLIRFLWERREGVISALREDSPTALQSMLLPATENQLEESLYSEGIEHLARMMEGSGGKLWSISDRIDDMNAELNRTSYELGVLPSLDSIDINVRLFHQEVETNQKLLARQESSLTTLENEEKQLKQDLERINDELSELSEKNSDFRRLDAQWTLCANLQNVLERFISDYRSTRIEELEDTLDKKFRELTNSPETIGRVEIDKETFEINTILRSETNLAASEGSAGQKEVMAFSLIASVVELSDRQIPFIIDTPLARLDTVHRDNILTNFFPNVGEQVIILSTDAEIGWQQQDVLRPYLASEHHLKREDGRTSIEEGYLV